MLIENPHQIQIKIILPINGIAVIKFVITVAPHKLICPQGKTYPKNAVSIEIKKIIIPENHKKKLCTEYDLNKKPRSTWK